MRGLTWGTIERLTINTPRLCYAGGVGMVTTDVNKYLILDWRAKKAWFLEQLISQGDLQEIMRRAARRFSINRGVSVSEGREKRLCEFIFSWWKKQAWNLRCWKDLCMPFGISTAYRDRQLSIFPKFLATCQTGYIEFYDKQPNCWHTLSWFPCN